MILLDTAVWANRALCPQVIDPIVQLLEDAADGAHTHGAAIGLVHNDEAHIRADLIALVGKPAGPGGVPPAVPGFKSLWNAAQTNKSTKTAALRTAQSNARLYVRTCIRSLFPVLGESWSGHIGRQVRVAYTRCSRLS